MKKWYLKAIIQKAISFLPYRNRINFFFQKYVTRGVDLTEGHFSDKFGHLCDHLAHFDESFRNNISLSGISCLELGTGWYPIIPLGYFLKGAEHVYSVDISAHLTRATFLRCLEVLEQYQERVRNELGEIDETRWQLLDRIRRTPERYPTLADLCRAVRFTPLVEDARQLQIADAQIRLISSNNTYEHIYPTILSSIVTQLWSQLEAGGIMSHFIDMSDHFAHMDQGIDIYNFLRFTDQQWTWIDNRIQPQNRWRLQQYRELYHTLGIPFRESKIRPGDIKLVEQTPLASPFAEMDTMEVSISHAYLVSKK